MGWCGEHLETACLFAGEETLRRATCPEERGEACTLVELMLALHTLDDDVRRRLIPSLYPPYPVPATGGRGPAPGRRRSQPLRSQRPAR